MDISQYRDRNWLAPWREFNQVSRRLNRVFGDPGLGDREGSRWLPPVNVGETKDELILTAELPGLKQEDVELGVENNVLTIRGQKEETREETEEWRYHVWERRYGSFRRSFTLPRTVSRRRHLGFLRRWSPSRMHAEGSRIEGSDDQDHRSVLTPREGLASRHLGGPGRSHTVGVSRRSRSPSDGSSC